MRYTLGGVAFLLGVPAGNIRRWASGYTRKLTYATVERPGVLGPDVDADGLFTFPALIELLYVRELLKPFESEMKKDGKPITERRKLAYICRLAEYLRSQIGPYPLARSRLRELGRQLVTDQLHPDLFTNALDGQHLLVIADELVKSLKFDDSGLANLWYPDEDNKLVYINPHIRFGCPIVPGGVSTEMIFDRYQIGETTEDLVEWFGVSPEEIKAAIKFEEVWRSKSKAA